jgi:carbon storage regulator
MLILTRAENEKIKIGDDIEIMVVRVTGRKVRLGIECPDTLHVVRSELECDHTWTMITIGGGGYVKKCSRCTKIEDQEGRKVTYHRLQELKGDT